MKKRIIAMNFIVFMTILLFTACNASEEKQQQTTAAPNAASENDSGNIQEESDSGKNLYDFPALDCGGEDFTFLNVTTEWDFYTAIVQEEIQGEALSDAIYNRNRLIEEKFNVQIKEVGVLITEMTNRLRNTIMAGDDLYDAAYCPGEWSGSSVGTLAVSNLFHNLKNVPELQLEQNWWNQNINKDALIGDSDALYFTTCDINIMNLQGAWCVYFNEDMFKNLGLDMPYEKVKSGKWTLDELYAYMKVCTQLNSAESFERWDSTGDTVYGLTSYEYGIGALLFGAGERYITKDAQKMPVLAIESERFFNVSEKIASMTQARGEYVNANNYDTGFHFEMIFRDNRAGILIGELKAADVFRTMESTYGIVPLPKYDEVQASYHTTVHHTSPMLVIPVTNTNLPRTGVILDALAYVSHKDVTPVFYDITLSLKRLQNEDSIEMLKIIRDSVNVDLGIAFGWTSDLMTRINTDLDAGRNNIVSLIEKNRDRVVSNIEKTMEYFEN
jgi:ABC-type glycerol-3-phosphate transport system substrate-binding protein